VKLYSETASPRPVGRTVLHLGIIALLGFAAGWTARIDGNALYLGVPAVPLVLPVLLPNVRKKYGKLGPAVGGLFMALGALFPPWLPKPVEVVK
jgi:hypothetical protein